ncbi:MAG: DnaJ domain-containing protein [Verrucomicrobia bacterium]|nr:DnaJ domain-containing protein [Verrucomicrobiota bacterium]
MIVEAQDYYELLGISRKATGEEIRKAFRKLARQFHPDLADDKTEAEERFKKINEAYEVLGDPENRKNYDSGQGRWQRFSGFGSRHVRPRNERFRRRSWGENFRPYTERPEFRSFYEDFFGGRRGSSGNCSASSGEDSSAHFSDSKRQRRAPQRGSDIEGEVTVTLNEVLNGSIHTIAVLRTSPVTGEPERRSLHVRIPSGVRNAQILRLTGRGDYGIAGGAAGDLYLRVKVADHPDFHVQGTDLFCGLELTPWEALFGTKRRIPTLEGAIGVRVPPGMNSGQRLRLRGKGLPNVEGIRGDLYVSLSVKVRLRDFAKNVFGRR